VSRRPEPGAAQAIDGTAWLLYNHRVLETKDKPESI
jgi:hypothetical protein